MGSKVRNFFIASIVMATVAVATTNAHAETAIKVPFKFTVAGKTCPAGIYIVDRDANSHLIKMHSRDGIQAFHWLIGPGNPNPTDNRVILHFDDLGQNHSLRSVQYGSMITSKFDDKTKTSDDAVARGTKGQ